MIAPPVFYRPSFSSRCSCCCIYRKDQAPPLIPATGTNILMVVLILAGFIWLVVRWIKRGELQ